jgi:ribulose-phosphate 3-epimerase
MTEIIPAILAKDERAFIEKIERVRALGLMLHIDVMDGEFVPEKTWAPPERMREILGDTPFEAHLMVAAPEHLVPVWLAAGATRVIFHAEATTRESLICRINTDECKKLAIAINPDTPVSRITDDLLATFRQVMVMDVTPGRSGQKFQKIALEKIKALRELKPDLLIAVDGGVKSDNAAALIEAGADVLVIGSALTDAPDPSLALLKFRTAIDASRK